MSPNKIYGTHEMTLLAEMWERFTKGTFYEQAWWQSTKVFQTCISLWPDPNPKPVVTTSTILGSSSKPVEVIMYNNEKYTFLASGTKRKTFVSPDKSHVIKVPKKSVAKLGIEENLEEAKVYSENPNSIYAKCELIENDWLKMEYVEPAFFSKSDEYPDWITQIAEAQVGHNKDGVLVAYDYGSEI